MPTRIGKSARQHIAERLAHDPEFAEAMAETHLEGELAKEIVRLRTLRRMSQYDLATAAGIKQPMINRIEKGAQNPTLPTLKKLAVALKATIQIGASGVELRPDAPEYGRRIDATDFMFPSDIVLDVSQFFGPTQVGWRGKQSFVIPEISIPSVTLDSIKRTTSIAQTAGLSRNQSVQDDNQVAAPISHGVQKSQELITSFMQPVA